ncbi:hypothetical protein CR203_00045 [Salipaludibacillus neizhouensis]|uniref:N-acetyltransferase domain-containing protein n=1 Tax=Salipaludibacillus neizhouensis TaxID=885475 RepID=A0A3A9KV45_9BACI|nr:GNAT family N-acetyltransferase [Salipaludibacillus neizhouensis]RKL68486.1 hypothetical protein CR203_00045 [Salipaludibacillus neizhouensis]
MKFFRQYSAVTMLKEVENFLVDNEAEHNLPLGILKQLAKSERKSGQTSQLKDFLMVIGKEDDSKPNIVLVRTPQRNLIICGHKSAVHDAAIWTYKEEGLAIPGVIGCSDLVTDFSEKWKELTSCNVVKVMQQKIYQLASLRDFKRTKGKLCYANEDDIALIMSWTEDFERDTLGMTEHKDLEKNVLDEIEHNRVFLWKNENCTPVSMAKRARELENGVVVNFVYTPDEYQGQGYATSCVAALSERLLQEGFQFCSLNTDAENPTSNSIYMKIGYEFVGDAIEYRFDYV